MLSFTCILWLMMFSCDFCFRKFSYQMMMIIIVNTYCALLLHQAWLHRLPRMNLSNPHNNPAIVFSYSVVSNSSWLHSPPGSSVHGASPGKNTGVGCHDFLQGIFPTQGSNPSLLYCRRILLPSEPPGKPKNTGLGSLSLLQGIFQTQELNWVLPHCWWILYQLSY